MGEPAESTDNTADADNLREGLIDAIAAAICAHDEDPALDLDWGSTDALARVAADAALAELAARESGSSAGRRIEGEHDGCNYFAVLDLDGFWFCNKCGQGWEQSGSNQEGTDG